MRLSFSTIDMFKKCRRWFYLAKIAKLDVPIDTKHLDRGHVVHSCLEKYYKERPDLSEIKKEFEGLWHAKKLDVTFPSEKDDTWLMIMRGINYQLDITHMEYKFEYSDPAYLGYADVLNNKTHWIGDYKTSTWMGPESEHEYHDQLKYYAWAHHRDFGVVPIGKIFWLKYNNRIIPHTFTLEDCKEVEQEIRDINAFIESHKNMEDYEMCAENKMLCPRFCPYKQICNNLEFMEFNLQIAKGFIFFKDKLPIDLLSGLKKEYTYEVQNAKHIRENSTWDAFRRLFDVRTSALGIGFQKRLMAKLERYAKFKNKHLKVNIERLDEPTIIKMPMPEKLTVELRPYQNDAIEAFMKDKIGIYAIATGGGKTLTALETIRRVGVKTLFIVNTKELLRQTEQKLKEQGFDYGIVQGKNIDFNHSVVLGMSQTLIRLIPRRKKGKMVLPPVQYNGEFLKFHMVVTDECHCIAADTFRLIHRSLKNAVYRLGLSATPFREDGDDLLIEERTGPVLINIPAQYLIEHGYLTKPKLKFIRLDNSESADKYPDDYNVSIVANMNRNDIIRDIVKFYPDKKILILTKQIEHGAVIADSIPGAVQISSKTNGKRRKLEYERFLTSGGKVLVTTIQIAGQGIDIPDLDIIINAAGNKSDTRSIQAIGRVLRTYISKDTARYYDFLDDGTYTKSHARKRFKALAGQGHTIEILTEDEFNANYRNTSKI